MKPLTLLPILLLFYAGQCVAGEKWTDGDGETGAIRYRHERSRLRNYGRL